MATIIRVSHGPKPYVVIDRRPLEDERLSWAARGVMGYLLAKPDDWALSIEDLRRRGDLGRDALYRIIRQLQHYGYLERRTLRDAKGRIVQTDYVVYEVPRTVLPLPEKPDTAEPDTGEPDTAQPTLLSNKGTKEPVNQVTTTPAATGDVSDTTSPSPGGGWEFPKSFSEHERAEASGRLHGIPSALGQALLDELAGRMHKGAVRGSPLAYLRGLIRRAQAGEFTPEVGLPIAQARARRNDVRAAVRSNESLATALPPLDPDHPVAKRVAQIRARASGRAPQGPSGGDGER